MYTDRAPFHRIHFCIYMQFRADNAMRYCSYDFPIAHSWRSECAGERRREEKRRCTLSTGFSLSLSPSICAYYGRGGRRERRREGLSTLARDLRMRIRTHTQTIGTHGIHVIHFDIALLLNSKAKKKRERKKNTLLNGRERARALELRLFLLFISRNCKIKSERVARSLAS